MEQVDAHVINASEIVLENKIGSGGFAEVWKGRCRGAEVAVKFLLTFNEHNVQVGWTQSFS